MEFQGLPDIKPALMSMTSLWTSVLDSLNFHIMPFPPVLMGGLLCLVLLICTRFLGRLLKRRSPSYSTSTTESKNPIPSDTATTASFYNNIPADPHSMPAISRPPLQIYPFRPTYHLTMGLQNCTLAEICEFDNTYEARIALRRKLMANHADETLACVEPDTDVRPILTELYAWLFGTYLPQRQPDIFKLEGQVCINLVTGERVPTTLPADTLPVEALRTMGSHVDCEFMLLLPRTERTSGEEKYHLVAFNTCFPTGFSPRAKLGLPLAGIHAPVPRYADKLEKSMDRFFAALPPGKIVKRHNWSVVTNPELYNISGNHFTDKDTEEVDLEDLVERQRAEVVPEECHLRVERQTLHRLPETKALVFAFKTYMYPLPEIKADRDTALALADAVRGFEKGSAPEMAVYKRQVVWGDKVSEYLRSDTPA